MLIWAAFGESFCIQETPDRRKCNVDFRKITPLDTQPGMNLQYEEAFAEPFMMCESYDWDLTALCPRVLVQMLVMQVLP